MAVVDIQSRTIQAKIVYFGPAQSGKTTNLRVLRDLLPEHCIGSESYFEGEGEATVFFDALSVHLGSRSGFDVTVRLFTVSGEPGRNDARQAVMAGADGVVFVTDASQGREDENIASMAELTSCLTAMHPSHDLKVPVVVQYNKLDLNSRSDPDELPDRMQSTDFPSVYTSALHKRGVLETLELVTRAVLKTI